MKIEREFITRESIENFADRHGLTMRVNERSTSGLPRFYARFKDVEVGNGCILIGAFGNGDTEDEAIAAYAAEISKQRLIVNAGTAERREIIAPVLFYGKDEAAGFGEKS